MSPGVGEKNGTTRLSRFFFATGLVCGCVALAPAEDIKGVLLDQIYSGKADLRIAGAPVFGRSTDCGGSPHPGMRPEANVPEKRLRSPYRRDPVSEIRRSGRPEGETTLI
jgi:hypothetical protein